MLALLLFLGWQKRRIKKCAMAYTIYSHILVTPTDRPHGRDQRDLDPLFIQKLSLEEVKGPIRVNMHIQALVRHVKQQQ